jgi:2-polyprenyl-3-methyl-5-hydroxy-6-metoxy-1,4-benzoquinol methylase
MSHADILTKSVLEHIPEGNFTVFDVACGFGDWGYLIKTRKDGNYHLTGVDVWKPYLENLRHLKIYNELIEADIRYYEPPKKYDIIIACEVLEHLKKEEGFQLLNKLESACDRRIIISTPHGFTHQGPLENNNFQRHVSEWFPIDFKNRRYKIKLIRQPLGVIRLFKRTIRRIFGKPYVEFIIAHKDINHT